MTSSIPDSPSEDLGPSSWFRRPLGPVNPFELWLLLAATVQGGLTLIGISRSATIQSALPPTLRLAWALLMLIGGVLSLAGVVWPRDPWTAIEVKRVGLVSAGIAALAYGVALAARGPVGFGVATSYVAFALACGVRVWQIGQALRVARGYLDTQTYRDRRRGRGG